MENSSLMEVERIGEVTIVTPLDWRLLEDWPYQDRIVRELGKELHALVESGGHRNILLDMSRVGFRYGTDILGLLVAVDKKTRAVGGSVSLCGVPEEAQEVFAVTRLDYVFQLYRDRETALEAYGRRQTEIACPFEDCVGRIRSVAMAAGRDEPQWFKCPACGCRFAAQPQEAFSTHYVVIAMELSVHPGTIARLSPVSDEPSVHLEGPHRLEIEGVLDVSAADPLERLWEVLPRPRRLVLDLRSVTEQTKMGIQATVRVASSHGADHWCVLVASGDCDIARAFQGVGRIFRDAQQALEALASVPESPAPFLVLGRHIPHPMRDSQPHPKPAPPSEAGCLSAIIILTAILWAFVLSPLCT